MQSRLMWFRIMDATDRATYRHWVRIIAVFYAAIIGGVIAVTATSARHRAENAPLLAATRSY
jgi:hypothetical protein